MAAPTAPHGTFVPQYSIPAMAVIPAIAAGSGSGLLMLMLLIACCKFRCKKSSRESKFELLEESQSFLDSRNSSVRVTTLDKILFRVVNRTKIGNFTMSFLSINRILTYISCLQVERNRGRGTALASTVIVSLCVFLLSLFFFCNFIVGESNLITNLGETQSWTREAGLVYFSMQGNTFPMPILLQLVLGLVLFVTLSFYVHIMTLWYNFETFEYATEHDRELLYAQKTRSRWFTTSFVYYLIPVPAFGFGFLWHLVIYPALESSLKQYQVFFLLQALVAWGYALLVRLIASRTLARTFPVGSLAYDQRSIHLNCNVVVASVVNFMGVGLAVAALPVLRAGRPAMPMWEQFRAMEILVLLIPLSIDGIHWFHRSIGACCGWRSTKSWSTTSEMDATMTAISLSMVFGWLQPSCLGIGAGVAAYCLLSNRIRGWACNYRRSSVLACIGMLRCIFFAWVCCLPYSIKAAAWVFKYDNLIYAKWLPCYALISIIFFAFWLHLGKSVERRYLQGSSSYVREMAANVESCCWRTSW